MGHESAAAATAPAVARRMTRARTESAITREYALLRRKNRDRVRLLKSARFLKDPFINLAAADSGLGLRFFCFIGNTGPEALDYRE